MSPANPDSRPRPARSGAEARRKRIVAAAMPLFAEHGYAGARMDDLAATLGIAKGSIFQHFGSKEKLFIEVYQAAVRTFPRYLDAPEEVRRQGFFDVLRYWLIRTDDSARENWVPFRIQLLGNYATDFAVKRAINRFHMTEDPFGLRDFVRYGLERNELRGELDIDVAVTFIGWMVDRFQDALVTEELDPGLFRHPGASPEKKRARVDQFLDLIRRALGTQPVDRVAPRSQRRRPQIRRRTTASAS